MRLLVAAALAGLAIAAAPAPLREALHSHVDTSAADRFAKVWRASGGKPSATDFQKRYLDGGGRPIAIFTPGRIRNASHLQETVAANPSLYRDAVERCLPWAADQDDAFRAVNLGLRGLLPERMPPAVAIVIGANNSGGTAEAGMQVIGLEVICRLSSDRAAFDRTMRNFFAHEATHTFQRADGPKVDADWLLTQVIQEGTADYVAHTVTGIDPDPRRSAWATERGGAVWADFLADRAVSAAHMKSAGDFDDDGTRAVRRWIMNAGSAPDGWPGEAGYWVGEQIVRAYIDSSPDPAVALEHLLSFDDPQPILTRAADHLPALQAAMKSRRDR